MSPGLCIPSVHHQRSPSPGLHSPNSTHSPSSWTIYTPHSRLSAWLYCVCLCQSLCFLTLGIHALCTVFHVPVVYLFSFLPCLPFFKLKYIPALEPRPLFFLGAHRPYRDNLKAAIKATWASITSEQCHRLIASMPRHIDAVIHAKGGPIKY